MMSSKSQKIVIQLLGLDLASIKRHRELMAVSDPELSAEVERGLQMVFDATGVTDRSGEQQPS